MFSCAWVYTFSWFLVHLFLEGEGGVLARRHQGDNSFALTVAVKFVIILRNGVGKQKLIGKILPVLGSNRSKAQVTNLKKLNYKHGKDRF